MRGFFDVTHKRGICRFVFKRKDQRHVGGNSVGETVKPPADVFDPVHIPGRRNDDDGKLAHCDRLA